MLVEVECVGGGDSGLVEVVVCWWSGMCWCVGDSASVLVWCYWWWMVGTSVLVVV